MKIPIICISSFEKNYGKTTLIEGIIENLKDLKICVIKHSSHKILDDYGKDTWRYRKAGAFISAIISKIEDNAIIYLSNKKDTMKILYKLKPDLIICEGFKNSKYPKLLIIKNQEEIKKIEKIPKVIGIISDIEIKNLSIPILKNDPKIISKFIISYMKGIKNDRSL
jgi:molybdopterin-guanine dinucleotide biosynthesis protein B